MKEGEFMSERKKEQIQKKIQRTLFIFLSIAMLMGLIGLGKSIYLNQRKAEEIGASAEDYTISYQYTKNYI